MVSVQVTLLCAVGPEPFSPILWMLCVEGD
jgi:hypothetical protein